MKYYLNNVFNILIEGGTFILISHLNDTLMNKYLNNYEWNIENKKLEKVQFDSKKEISYYYLYICRKKIIRFIENENIDDVKDSKNDDDSNLKEIEN